MSRLQLKSVLKRHRFVLELFGISAFVHCFALFFLLFVGRNTIDFRFNVSSSLLNQSVPVIFMPLQRRTTGKQAHAASKVVQPVKKSVSPAKKPATTMTAAKSTPKLTPAKTPAQKVEPAKKPVVNKPAPKTPAKKVEPVAKKESIQPVAKPQEAAKKVEPELPQDIQIPQHVDVAQVQSQDAIIVGQEEFDAMQMQMAVQEEMARIWRPPVGVSKDVCCDVALTFDFEGNIKEVVIQKSSGMPMFDTSVRQAVYQFKAPRWAHGKTMNISFRQ